VLANGIAASLSFGDCLMQHFVLLIDLEPAVLELAQKALTPAGAQVSLVEGLLAAETIHTRRPSIVVYESSLEWREDVGDAVRSLLPKPLTIVLSRERGRLEGDIHVPSPYDPHTLVGVILACVNETTLPPPSTDSTVAANDV
jgi:hypothetical protein